MNIKKIFSIISYFILTIKNKFNHNKFLNLQNKQINNHKKIDIIDDINEDILYRINEAYAR